MTDNSLSFKGVLLVLRIVGEEMLPHVGNLSVGLMSCIALERNGRIC